MKNYIRTFSTREVISALLSALMYFVLIFFLRQIGWYEYIEGFALLLATLPVLISHRIYFLEHRRQNSFLGRLVHDILILVFINLLGPLFLWVSGHFHEIHSITYLILFTSMIMVLIEVLLTTINAILNAFKWRIW